MTKPSPTGDYPNGMVAPDDAGALNVGFKAENGTVLMFFGTEVKWIGLDPDSAERFGKQLLFLAEKARQQLQ